jgi:hypothetical protein
MGDYKDPLVLIVEVRRVRANGAAAPARRPPARSPAAPLSTLLAAPQQDIAKQRRHFGLHARRSFEEAAPDARDAGGCAPPPAPAVSAFARRPRAAGAGSAAAALLGRPRTPPPSARGGGAEPRAGTWHLGSSDGSSGAQRSASAGETASDSASRSGRSSLDTAPADGAALPPAAELAAFLQEAFGAHLAGPPAAPAGRASPRSSLDALLAPRPGSAAGSAGSAGGGGSAGGSARRSLDRLQELLSPPPAPARFAHSASQGALPGARGSMGSAPRGAGAPAPAGAGRFSLQFDPSTAAAASAAASSRLSSLSDLASLSVTVVAAPGARRGGGGAAAPGRPACASSLVDGSLPPAPGAAAAARAAAAAPPAASATFGGAGAPAAAAAAAVAGERPEEPRRAAMLDADVHDTFGGHAWYCGPSAAGGGAATRPAPAAPAPGARPASARAAAAGAAAAAAARADGAAAAAARAAPTSVPGQHSVTLGDRGGAGVPTLAELRHRAAARAAEAAAPAWGGGYIAEAKRVLAAAVGAAEAAAGAAGAEGGEDSYAGAIGPLLSHLRAEAADPAAARAGLRTLSVLLANGPNREVVREQRGRAALAAVLRACPAADARERAAVLLYELDDEAGRATAPLLGPDDLAALAGVLEATADGGAASAALHLLAAALEGGDGAAGGGPEGGLPPPARLGIARRLVREALGHRHRLTDAAQYALGAAVGAALAGPGVRDAEAHKLLAELLGALCAAPPPPAEQCQVLLTALSCAAGRPRLRDALAAGGAARRALAAFAAAAADARLRARALSLAKALARAEEHPPAHPSALWYLPQAGPSSVAPSGEPPAPSPAPFC